jgi:hypothetical protein
MVGFLSPFRDKIEAAGHGRGGVLDVVDPDHRL